MNDVWSHMEVYHVYWEPDPSEPGDGRAIASEYFSGELRMFLANWEDNYQYKSIWVQISFGGAGTPYVWEVVAPPWGDPYYGELVEIIEIEPGKYVERWLLQPNPDREFINIVVPIDTWVDEVIVDTISGNTPWPPGGMPNDDCQSATPINEVNELPFSTKTATADGERPCWVTGGPPISPNIWYVYTPTCTGVATIDYDPTSPCGSNYLATMAIYRGTSCDPLGEMIYCEPDQYVPWTFPVTAGEEYLIEMFGLDPYTEYKGTGSLTITCEDINYTATVVCEPQGGQNPSHPPTYWYDVSTEWPIHDFHVRVYDPNQENYSSWVAPAGWLSTLTEIDGESWVCWCDPELDDPITSFRFGFDNDSPSKWGAWVTTGNGFCDFSGVLDRSTYHYGDEDGLGGRVHVPVELVDEPCQDCGPGAHWIDTCAGGTDYMPSGATVGIDLDGDCIADTNLVMRGPVRVRRSDPLDDSASYPGLRTVDGHLDVIDTEILEMELTGGGATLKAGLGQGQNDVLPASLGAIAEVIDAPEWGDSFFDVYFEIDLGGGSYAYNHEALQVGASIECVPPRVTYAHIDELCLALYNDPDAGEGEIVAWLVSANHSPYAVTDWNFDDTGVTGWGQSYDPPDSWEPMNAGPLEEDCIFQDLMTEVFPFYAASSPIDIDYSGYRFYAQIWLGNNYAGASEEVTVELRRGAWGDEGELVASDTVYVTNLMEGNPLQGKPYLFDFGTIDDLDLDGESLVLKIMHWPDMGGNTHIWWHGEYCSSGLHAIMPGFPGYDTVVCEPQDENPVHPPTYWYDVTPTEFGRCDFHVRVYDPFPENYTNWQAYLPAATWQFAVHQVGDEWWASWWDPDCLNAIFGTHRFRFDNPNPSTWGDWRTTIGADANPAMWVIDFSGHHFTEADGEGYRVHVPQLPAPTDDCHDAPMLQCPSSITGSTIGATIDDAPYCVTSVTAPGVWVSVIGTGNTMTATTCNAFSNYDTKLCVYRCGCDNLACVTGNDDSCQEFGNLLSTVEWCGQVGEEYFILIHGWNALTGDFQLDIYDDGVPCGDPITFTNSGQNLVSLYNSDAQWGDFDGDGDLDLAICGENSSVVAVTKTYENQAGTLVFKQDLDGVKNTGSGCLAWGDYDNDGDLDLAIAGIRDDSVRITGVYENADGAGNLIWDASLALTGVNGVALAWGDYDNDGDLDLVVCGSDGTNRLSTVYDNDGAGGLVAGPSLVGLASGSADWGDCDNDGDLDLLLTGHDGAAPRTILYINGPVGTLTADETHGIPGVYLSDAAWGDCDADGDLDLLITGNQNVVGSHVGRVYANDGAGVFTQLGGNFMSVYRSSCAWGDYDNDGDLDFSMCGYTSYAIDTRIYRNTGTGFVHVGFGIIDLYEGSLTWADVDGDGRLDLLITGYFNWTTPYTRLYMNGGGVVNEIPTAPTSLAVDQCDGLGLFWDGALDCETDSDGLYYQVRVVDDDDNIVMSGEYGTPLKGTRALQGDGLWLDVPRTTYRCSVRTIDSSFATSPWTDPVVAYAYGDMDCDGDVDFDDIDPFVLALSGEMAYLAQYPDCRWLNADCDCDGDVDFDDIDAFVARIGS